jgi:hypothetical protein
LQKPKNAKFQWRYAVSGAPDFSVKNLIKPVVYEDFFGHFRKMVSKSIKKH